MLRFDDGMTVRMRASANDLLAETAYLVMMSTLIFGESNLGRLDHGVQEFASGEGFILQEHHETMSKRPELFQGCALFETGQIYLETLASVLTQMHFIFHSQQHTVAAQKVQILKDGIPNASDFRQQRPRPNRIESDEESDEDTAQKRQRIESDEDTTQNTTQNRQRIESDDDELAKELESELARQID